MPKLQKDNEPIVKDNLLPFPSLQAAPRDPPRSTVWRGLLSLALIGAGLGLFALTLWALFM